MVKNKVLRGRILSFLYEIAPEGIERLGLLGVFYSRNKIDSIDRELDYLTEKGYISVKEDKHPFKKEKVLIFKILPKGTDLVTGEIEDSAVLLPLEEE